MSLSPSTLNRATSALYLLTYLPQGLQTSESYLLGDQSDCTSAKVELNPSPRLLAVETGFTAQWRDVRSSTPNVGLNCISRKIM
ncbi:hypothetical protein Slin15195_G122230 [Septoria linicola]|uniref:Uncharacterized protein n=1 Tax=Septoria linicola TaxID=215465 RepID=A0A9Q9EQL6_9PEZI|nr:hypothetical protein Slin15195_G122230 [Septoria linicola]